MSRVGRREWRQRVELYRERVCGIDIGKATVAACVRIDKGPGVKPSLVTRTFSTTTAGLLLLLDWLRAQRVQLVGMESTGVYWKRPFYLLETTSRFGCSIPSTSRSCRAARAT